MSATPPGLLAFDFWAVGYTDLAHPLSKHMPSICPYPHKPEQQHSPGTVIPTLIFLGVTVGWHQFTAQEQFNILFIFQSTYKRANMHQQSSLVTDY